MFTVTGRPVPKGRPRKGKGGVFYTPPKTKKYERKVAEAFKSSGSRAYMGGEPLIVDMRFYFKIPNHTTKKEQAYILQKPYYTKKVDLDNLEKSVLDGLNGIAFEDDRQVVIKYSEKVFDTRGKGERVEIDIREVK